jgi:osmotically-inducible protein OsmY
VQRRVPGESELELREEVTMDATTALQRRVLDELEWEPSVDATKIGVAVSDHIVTLTGWVSDYAKKLAAERAVKRVMGVRAVVNDLEVQPQTPEAKTDTELANAVLSALAWHVAVPHEQIQVRVSRGWVTLEGQVNLQFQRAAAEQAVQQLAGVRGVTNLITIAPAATAGDVKARIEAAFKRSAEIDASRVQVETQENKVILRGRVRSWSEREEAENAAWAAPGITAVEDEIIVGG